jgi:hypothetical protein
MPKGLPVRESPEVADESIDLLLDPGVLPAGTEVPTNFSFE